MANDRRGYKFHKIDRDWIEFLKDDENIIKARWSQRHRVADPEPANTQ
jgi:hypothetical protein